MLIRVIAILAAPVFLTGFFVATTPSVAQIRPGLLWGGYYALAHLFFWPPAIATAYLAKRLRIGSTYQVAALMGICSVIATSAAFIPTLMLWAPYTWHAAVRDALSEAVAAAGGLILYRSILRLGQQTSVAAAPNNRWRGP
jgi:hypothetical protein